MPVTPWDGSRFAASGRLDRVSVPRLLLASTPSGSRCAMKPSFADCVRHLQMHAAAGETQEFLARLVEAYSQQFGYDPIKLLVYMRNYVTYH